jgi:hypothetical protein
MKTKLNISRNLKNTLAVVSILALSTVAPLRAGNNTDTMTCEKETLAIINRLDQVTVKMEASLAYVAPEVTETYEMYEANAAMERIESAIENMEKTVVYTAPSVTDETEANELRAAFERLDAYTASLEESVKFVAPDVFQITETVEYLSAVARLNNSVTALEVTVKYSAPAVNEALVPEMLPVLAKNNMHRVSAAHMFSGMMWAR